MSYQALILAGGAGTRLMPLTGDIPKPLFPVAGVENLRRTIELLCKGGVSDAVVCVKYKKEKIMSAIGDLCAGVNLKYYVEEEPLGTAGAARAALEELEEDFFVVSADVVCDFTLSEALAYHRENNADVTIVTHREVSPLAFGIVMCARDGRVVRFCEKPGWEQVFSDTVNTGIYIMKKTALAQVPAGAVYDFSRDLFPRLISRGFRVFGYEESGYWADIGVPAQYLQVNRDALAGKIGIDVLPRRHQSLIRSFAGEGYSAGEGAKAVDSVLFDGVSVGSGSRVEGCVIASDVFIGDDCVLKDCIIAAGCVVPAGKKAEGAVIVRESDSGKSDIKEGESMIIRGKQDPFFDGCITLGLCPGELGDICACGAAAAQATSGKLGVVYSERFSMGQACAAAELFTRGACLYGGRVCSFGEGGEEYAGVAGRYFGCETTALIEQPAGISGCVRIRFFDKNGLPQTRVFEQAFSSALNGNQSAPSKAGEILKINALPELYCAALTASGSLEDTVIGLSHMKHAVQIKTALEAAGATVCFGNTLYGFDKYYFINASGSGTVLCDSDGAYSDMFNCLLMILTLSTPETLPRVALPYFAPRALTRAAEKNGIQVLYYLTRPSCEAEYDLEARELCGSLMFLRDPLFCAVRLLVLLKKLGISLAEACGRCEEMHVRLADISVSGRSKAAVLRALYEEYLPYQVSAADGVSFRTKQAEGTVMATDGRKLRLIISSYSEQYAADAVGELEKKIKAAAENDGTIAEQ